MKHRTRQPLRRTPDRLTEQGFSIIELLVALAIGMALTVAITLVMMRHEGTRRSLTSSNDSQINANYLGYVLDRNLRSAGTGFAQGWNSTYGCLLHAARNGTQILPRPSGFPAPFSAVNTQVRLAPLIIHAGAGEGNSDVLALAFGTAGFGESASRVQPGSATASSLNIPTTISLRGNDLVLIAEPGQNCMVQQLANPFVGGATQTVNMGGVYAAGTIGGTQLSNYSGDATLNQLGNTVGNPPQFQLIGLGASGTLFAYDLLRLTGSDTPQPMATGVADLQAVYWVDTNSDGRADTWVLPTTPGWTAANLQDGSPAARDRLRAILAVRIGLILRDDKIERENVSAASLTLFADLPAAVQHAKALSADEQRMRHRTLELTIPLRNTINQVN